MMFKKKEGKAKWKASLKQSQKTTMHKEEPSLKSLFFRHVNMWKLIQIWVSTNKKAVFYDIWIDFYVMTWRENEPFKLCSSFK